MPQAYRYVGGGGNRRNSGSSWGRNGRGRGVVASLQQWNAGNAAGPARVVAAGPVDQATNEARNSRNGDTGRSARGRARATVPCDDR